MFRLTQDEYRSLQEACTRAGGRNLSDFTRTELMQFLRMSAGQEPLTRRFAAIERQMVAIQTQLNDLLQGVFHAETWP